MLAFALARDASANLVQNGDFTDVSYSGSKPMTTLYGQFGTGTGSTLTVAHWSTTGYNFVYAPDTADAGDKATGADPGQPKEAPGEANGSNGYGNTYLWGPNNGGNTSTKRGKQVLPSTDPAGGNFIAADGAYETQAITQSITGLKVGQVYALTFYWAGAQQESYLGDTTESWTVKLGSQSQTTSTVTTPSQGFSGWMQETFYYTATSTTETLSFLAAGSPTGEPPFSLLGGVDLEVVPESSNWMVFAGFGMVCLLLEAMRRHRRRRLDGGSSANKMLPDLA